jgi:hypothetical protein
MFIRRCMLLAGLVALFGPAALFYADDAPTGAPYQIVLRSRHAEVTPIRTHDAQTGGGSILVEQPTANTIVVTLGGSAVVGSDAHGSAAAINFEFGQDLDIIPIRKGVRPPRIGMVGRVVGTLVVTDPCKCTHRRCGSADQGPAAASLSLGGVGLLDVSVKPSTVTCGQELAVNHREGPVECPAVPGCYHLAGSFHISATQGKWVCNRQFAVADFDPAPQLDGFWADALKPFRAVPRRDFGFKVVLRVIEDDAPIIIGMEK